MVMSFTTLLRFMVRIHSVLFGGKYDITFLPTKSAAVGLICQSQIKLMTSLLEKNIILVYEHLNQCRYTI